LKQINYLLLSICIASFGLFTPIASAENTIQLSKEQLDNLGITLGKLEPVKQIPLLNAPAKVVIPTTQEYIVSASQVGLVSKLIAAKGDQVKKGNLLAQLNSPDLLSMQRAYLKAVNELQLGSLAYQRDKKLVGEGVIADRRWQETQSQYNFFVAQVNEQKQLLSIAGMTNSEIDRLTATHQLSGLLNVYAPISGVVIERMIAAGERVQMQAPLYRIANLNELWLEINVPPERASNLNLGDQVKVEDAPVSAEIILIGQSINPENQTLLVRAIISGNQSYIRAGQTISTQIIQKIDRAFKVPNSAVAQNDGEAFIFIHIQDGFKISPIKIIGKQDEDAIISGDLNGDEELAIKGSVALKAKWIGLGGAE
jgi:cobalt-zinc-cadmium efflux system membrane fusion protein